MKPPIPLPEMPETPRHTNPYWFLVGFFSALAIVAVAMTWIERIN